LVPESLKTAEIGHRLRTPPTFEITRGLPLWLMCPLALLTRQVVNRLGIQAPVCLTRALQAFRVELAPSFPTQRVSFEGLLLSMEFVMVLVAL
jgi:hypothetical protein